MKRCLLMLMIASILSGCSMRGMTTRIIADISSDGMVAIEGEEDVDFARESMPALIKTLEVLRQGDPKDAKAQILLSKAYGTFAYGFLEEDLLRFEPQEEDFEASRKRADLFYGRGKAFGMNALESQGFSRRHFTEPFSIFEKALSHLGKRHVPALFWTAFSWAGWLNLHRDDPSAIIDLPRVSAIVNRIIELDDDYYYGSAHALRGVLAASRPQMLGGDLTLAQREFSKAMGMAPEYLFTRVLYGQYYARQMNDQALFERELNAVLVSDSAALPEQQLSNALAKRRAELLLKRSKTWF